MSKTLTRKSVPLTSDEIALVAQLRDTTSVPSAVLRRLAGLSGQASESAVLHALVGLGLQQVVQAADERGYAELAASYRTDTEDVEFRQAARARRSRSAARWDDEG